MNAKIKTHDIPTVAGTPYGGGYYAGRLRINGIEHAVIVAPKAEGETTEAWGGYGKEIEATSFCDGAANTKVMAVAGHALATWALALSIGGHSDWHIPSRDELEVCYRNLKPTPETNTRWSGDNPSNGSYPYTLNSPAQADNPDFQEGGKEAFDDVWHWSSTQCSAHSAWVQIFSDGSVNGLAKYEALRARAVRTIPVI